MAATAALPTDCRYGPDPEVRFNWRHAHRLLTEQQGRAKRAGRRRSLRSVAVDAALVAVVFAQSVFVALAVGVGRNMRKSQAKRRRLRDCSRAPAAGAELCASKRCTW
jgi:hypothetical protein